MAIIRQEETNDIPSIRKINETAFGRPDEAKVVDRLRDTGKVKVSLVAEEEEGAVGHLLLTEVALETLDGSKPKVKGVGLAPMAVLPNHQKRGIGYHLVQAALLQAREADFDYMVVLGHPEYYPRFGFVPGQSFGLSCEFESPSEAFMAVELRSNALRGVHGLIRYQPEFKEL